MLHHAEGKDGLIMAAAVADFRPAAATDEKIKKQDDNSAPTIVLEQTRMFYGPPSNNEMLVSRSTRHRWVCC